MVSSSLWFFMYVLNDFSNGRYSRLGPTFSPPSPSPSTPVERCEVGSWTLCGGVLYPYVYNLGAAQKAANSLPILVFRQMLPHKSLCVLGY